MMSSAGRNKTKAGSRFGEWRHREITERRAAKFEVGLKKQAGRKSAPGSRE